MLKVIRLAAVLTAAATLTLGISGCRESVFTEIGTDGTITVPHDPKMVGGGENWDYRERIFHLSTGETVTCIESVSKYTVISCDWVGAERPPADDTKLDLSPAE